MAVEELRCVLCARRFFTIEPDEVVAAFIAHVCTPDTTETEAPTMPTALKLPPLTDTERTLVERNLGLVHYFLRECRHTPSFVYDDRFQDGVLGLMRAAQKFNAEKGFTFSTYAMTWIRAAVNRGTEHAEGVNYRSARAAGNDYDVPLSLDSILADNDEHDANLAHDQTFMLVEDDLDAVDSHLDAVRTLALLCLTEDEITLLSWPCKDTARWLDITHQAVSDRRIALRKRLVARLEALAA